MIMKLDELVTEYKKHCTSYRFDLMASSLYSFIWNEYCDWYLEIAKIEIDRGNEYTKNVLVYVLQIILKLCHQFCADKFTLYFVLEDCLKSDTIKVLHRAHRTNYASV